MNWKKALAAGTLAVAAVTMVAGCGGQAKRQAEQKKADKIVIGLDDNFPPMGFRDDSGQLVGFDIDLAQEASKRLGIPVEFKPIDWDSKDPDILILHYTEDSRAKEDKVFDRRS